MPARGRVARQHVLAARQVDRAVDGDLVVVPQHDQPAQIQVPGKADRLMVDAFHQAAVARDHPGAVIDQIVAELGIQVPFRDRHADRGGQAGPERPGGRLDARQLEILRMAGARAVKLAEAGDVLDRRAGIAGQVQQAVDQHRSMARRQDEAIPVGPAGQRRIELHIVAEQHRRDVRHAHGHARMPAVRGFNGVHG